MNFKFVLKQKCPSCDQKVDIGWKYCSKCGAYIGNDGPRTILKGEYDRVTPDATTKETKKKSGTAFGQIETFLGKTKNRIDDTINQGDVTEDPAIQPFLFHITDDQVEVKQFPLHIISTNNSESIASFGNDVQGYYFLGENPYHSFVKNGKKIKPNKKDYLSNSDALIVDGEIYIFSVMNQKKTQWQSIPLNQLTTIHTEKFKFSENAYGSFSICPVSGSSPSEVYVNNTAITSDTILKEKDCILSEDRHFIILKNKMIFQQSLSKEEHLSLALNVNKIDKKNALDINIRERSVRLSNNSKKILLKNINLSISPGEMVLILGGSGAGKTTFINAVMGNEKADAIIKIGDYDLYHEFDRVKRMIGFVPQFDLLRTGDTVYMTLINAAQMKLPREFCSDRRLLEQRVQKMLHDLNLEKEADNLVSKLSGGQRKRLSIATEYISNPAVFILDEPDSGLDGSQARNLMHNLRSIADDEKIVLIISHSPDRTPELYDKVIVLAKSTVDNCGRLAFFGGVEEALTFFDTNSLKMIVGKITETPDLFIEKYEHEHTERKEK